MFCKDRKNKYEMGTFVASVSSRIKGKSINISGCLFCTLANWLIDQMKTQIVGEIEAFEYRKVDK